MEKLKTSKSSYQLFRKKYISLMGKPLQKVKKTVAVFFVSMES